MFSPFRIGVDGRLYGTVTYGPDATAGRQGAIVRFDPATAILERLYDFNVPGDGMPSSEQSAVGAPLAFGSDGALYGTTGFGGVSNYGTAFRFFTSISPNQAPTASASAAPALSHATSSSGADVTLSSSG